MIRSVVSSFLFRGASEPVILSAEGAKDLLRSESGSTSSHGAINASHTYLLPGSYRIRVTVTDSHGLSGSGEATLTVDL